MASFELVLRVRYKTVVANTYALAVESTVTALKQRLGLKDDKDVEITFEAIKDTTTP